MSGRRPYVRPLGMGWWTRNPVFVKYMIREASCIPIAIYSLILIVGLARLGQGPAAYDGWRDGLRHPLAIAFHVIALGLILYHCYTWIRITPKLLPTLWLQSHLYSPRILTIGSWALTAVIWGVFFLLAARGAGP